jgi:2-oxoisovalerate dehydrogenase E1 component alpha subunit
VTGEADCLAVFEQKLLDAGAIDFDQVEYMRQEANGEADEAAVMVSTEPRPTAADVDRFTYAPSPVDVVYPKDYSGLPSRK